MYTCYGREPGFDYLSFEKLIICPLISKSFLVEKLKSVIAVYFIKVMVKCKVNNVEMGNKALSICENIFAT